MAPELIPFIAIVMLLLLAASVAKIRAGATAAGIMLVAVAVFPRHIMQFGADTGVPPDMAPAVPTISTYTAAAIVGAIIVILSKGKWRVTIPHWIMLVVLVGMTLAVWQGSAAQWAGYIVVITAVSGWAIGAAFADQMRGTTSNVIELSTAAVVTVLLGIQLLLALLQLSGISMPTWLTSEGRLDVESNSRAIGTLGHPANLSKMAFLLMLVLLPLTASASRVVRRWASIGVIAAIVLGAVTVSRANILAIFLTFALWLIISPRGLKLGQRVAMLFGLGVISLVSLPMVVARFEDDPEGGARPELLGAGLEQVARDLWGGTGLNSYISTVSEFDPATRLGYPVHNTFLFVLAEYGLVSAALFFFPFIALIKLSLTTSRLHRSTVQPWARVTLCSIPGFIVITMTGWGMAGGSSLVLWFLVSGFFYQVLQPNRGTSNELLSGTALTTFPRKAGFIQ